MCGFLLSHHAISRYSNGNPKCQYPHTISPWFFQRRFYMLTEIALIDCSKHIILQKCLKFSRQTVIGIAYKVNERIATIKYLDFNYTPPFHHHHYHLRRAFSFYCFFLDLVSMILVPLLPFRGERVWEPFRQLRSSVKRVKLGRFSRKMTLLVRMLTIFK